MTNELINLIADLAIALSFIVALVFGIAQVKAAERDRRERLTLETLRNFQTHEFAELILFIISYKMPATGKEMDSLPVNDRIMFIQFAQQMESLGLLVAEKFITLDLVDKTLGSLVTNAWEKYKKMFLDIRTREKQPDPFVGEYFQWLAERIEERMRLHPRKPFHERAAASSGGSHG
jgi:hypothetical protein